MDEMQTVRGTVEQIVFSNEDNGYAVVRLLNEDGGELTATGCFPNLGLGEEMTLYGAWTTHPSYGEQFAAERFERELPASVKGISDYLSSGLIRGIGPRLGSKIAKKFGEETFEVLAHEPGRLTEIRGITEKKAYDICRQFTEQIEMRELMDFLTENGLPLDLTPRLYKRMGLSAIEALSVNPFLLCDEYYEVDFKVADQLAAALGLSRLAPERVDAGILYTLTFNLGNGHTFIPVEKLIQAVCSLLGEEDTLFEPARAEEGIVRLEGSGLLVREQIRGRDAVYLTRMRDAERYLADTLREMAERNFAYDFDVDALLGELTDDGEIAYAPLQRQAIATAAKNGLVVLTGGPGTGKTTTVRGIIRVFEALGLSVQLAAPTGRAAKRLSELCGMEAKTIHRLLEAGYGANGRLVFARSETNPLDCDAVILDEVSMVDIVLMQALLRALPFGARLILVGDADQLPPVGPGNFLRDIVGSGCVPVTRLTEIFRQAQQSDIVMNAHAINEGRMPVASKRDGDFFIIRKSDPAEVMQTVVDLCRERLPKFYGFDSSQIQVLSPVKRQGAGTVPLNRMLQEALNPPSREKPEKRFGDTVFRKGDRVMQIRNNYDIVWEKMESGEPGLGMFNGDVGEIIEIYPPQETLLIRFDDKVATYTYEMLGELDLAYAVTVHKSQGSEFDAVVVALSSGISRRMLTRNILYTSITRAKKLLVLVGSPETIARMTETGARNKRYSALKFRLRGEEHTE